jgi:hypothetical protein
MHDEQYTGPKGETYVLEEDPSRNGFYRPLVIKGTNGGRGRKFRYGDHLTYRPKSSSRSFVKLFGQWFFIEPWALKILSVFWDRTKLIVIVAIISPILFEKLPILLRFFFQP